MPTLVKNEYAANQNYISVILKDLLFSLLDYNIDFIYYCCPLVQLYVQSLLRENIYGLPFF